ncbi:tRNA uridine-5-carboxymethylaminomethyl(34) synthesis enzyme MnmG [Candidatus Vidania fulgoroideorum]
MNFDVIVIGGGHAGIEASFVSSKFKKTLLITNNIYEIGKIYCNPSIGGVGKGQLVREIEIFGGVMPIVSDKSCTFSKLLNKEKGYSLRSTRLQIDKYKYVFYVNEILRKKKNLSIIQSVVIDLIIIDSKIYGIILEDNTKIYSKCVILTTGTFLNNKIYSGNLIKKNKNNKLYYKLKKIIPQCGKFKTGTPPRIDERTIDFKNLKIQKNEKNKFSFLKSNQNNIFNCWITNTTIKTKDIVLKNINTSPLYNGILNSKGPRYCPSLEDKYIRFPHNKIHNVFLEKESYYTNEIYPNGLSTSFDFSLQLKIINSIKGLKDSEIIKQGYAIEYNYFNPINLNINLESKYIKNLFLAGQINGTTGYEEAASQGLIAGINAIKNINNKKPFILNKKKSYIGLLIYDITNNIIKEPYRMFTSRSKYRFYIREDNVIERLLNKSFKNKLIKKKKYSFLKNKLNYLKKVIKKTKKIKINYKNSKISIYNLIKKYNFKISFFKKNIKIKTKRKIFIDYINATIKYKCYYKKHKKEVSIINKKIKINIPRNFNFKIIKGLSKEFLEKVKKIKVNSIKDIYKIECITPTNIYLIKNFFIKNEIYSNK